MAQVLKEVAGNEYDLEVITDYSFVVLHNGNKFMTRTTKHEIAPHWEQEAFEAIKTIYEEKYYTAIKNI